MFFGKFGLLCFVVTPILRFAPFALLLTIWRNIFLIWSLLALFGNCFTFHWYAISIIFQCMISENGQVHFQYLVAFAAKFLKWIWPLWDIMMHWLVRNGLDNLKFSLKLINTCWTNYYLLHYRNWIYIFKSIYRGRQVYHLNYWN